jgi:hypothetical protein
MPNQRGWCVVPGPQGTPVGPGHAPVPHRNDPWPSGHARESRATTRALTEDQLGPQCLERLHELLGQSMFSCGRISLFTINAADGSDDMLGNG